MSAGTTACAESTRNVRFVSELIKCTTQALTFKPEATSSSTQNSAGSYRCVCKAGFRTKDGQCTDIDECKEIRRVNGNLF